MASAKLKLKELLVRNKFMWTAVFLLWIKTYVIYKVGFRISSEKLLQEFLLFINPLSSAVFLLGFCLFFRGKLKYIMVILVSLFATIVLYGNLVYYRFFSDFLTWPVLFQTGNAKDLQGSVFELMSPLDLFLLVDVMILLILFLKSKRPVAETIKYEKIGLFATALLLFIVNLTIAQIERPQLLTRAFDREMLVKNIGTFNYHIYDAFIQSKAKTQRVFASSSDILEVRNYTMSNYKKPDATMFGIAQDKNIILISMESIQSFVINKEVDGEEITPFLNNLIKDSYYFENFYHQTSQGKTSDSEFLVDNSLFGKDSGAVFFTHSGNEYNALPEILKSKDYYTSVMHANNKSFWNRDLMYEALGYDHFFDIASYEVTDENSIGWGLKDADFFEQSIAHLKSQPTPFYTKFITLTNHFPFELSEEDQFIDELDTNSRTLNQYVTTVRYMDYALEVFFDRLKAEGLYENAVFILYGDHYGISDYHNKAMSMFLEKEEITPFDSVQLQRVPMYIHIPGHVNNKTLQTVSGQIDVKPTILHMLGIEDRNEIQFGTDLFSPYRKSFVVLRDGSFVTDTHVYTKDTCYLKNTGEEVEMTYCEPYRQKAKLDLHYSDKMIYGDLLRFDLDN
ncbi:LTA synthase family protein [Anaerobacillus isosaccharinicus]|uniref:LTA synthase family protein n=1 Tax=Anaerobacillus isosaccharinicus TaxID=1532552 RepID=A0A1S2L1G4_9BACI|nr:LTA synthase family protein [Anaerobacillus isosaccharinicus]MBA5588281.1 LTA synthase family protein [Anaerobacillus isosaccharinicus]QOY38282.1 LTA synthase family protein [Anaerobacillus isosaccharinicus]